jgi:hypothetical protein
MMNREVMSRQMFAKGGAAFPDLSGDGKVTQKDILMGRGVLPMQEGGMAPMPAPAAPGPQMMPPGIPPVDPNSVDINQAAQSAMQQGIDPAVLEGMLTEYSAGLEDLENAEDYETVINGIRGDQAPIEQRYQELASVVGQEDAQSTPESVLTLVQPVMQIALVDQGIGGLAAEEMSAPVEGAMAEGIMSTVNMGGPDQAQGGPAPVNFNQGGSVAYMENGGDSRLGQIYQDKQAVYGDILGMADQEAEFTDQQQMTRAQMLFDVAQGALMFATPGETRMSPAERLAQAFTPVLGNISARAGDLQKFKNEQKREKRALNLQALGSAENQLSFELKTAADAAAAAKERTWKSQEKAEDRAHELLKMDRTFAFNREENESNQSFQMRLAERKIAAQTLLQELQGAQSQADITLRGRLQNELAQLNNAFSRTMQNDRFDFQNKERLGTQAYQDLVREQQFANEQALLAITGSQRQADIQLRNNLEQENMALANEYTVANNKLAFENQLKRDGILNGFEIGRMDRGFEQSKALASHRGEIEKEARLIQNTFTAAENALDRAQKENLTLTGREFEKQLRIELKEMDIEQADIDRGIAKINRAFDEALATRQADQKDVTLSLAERAQVLDETYKLGMLAVEELAANSIKLGSDAKSKTISYLTNEQRLDDYANGTLGDETTTFEQAVLDYVKPERVWNSQLGVYTEGAAPQLAPRLQQAIQSGNPELFQQISKGEVGTGTGAETGATKTGEAVNLMGATAQNSDIMNADGTINLESNVFELTAPNRYNPDIDYKKVIGLSGIFPGLKKIVSEGYAEATDGMPTQEAQDFSEAQKTLDAFANDLLQFSTNLTGDRVLKFVQELIERETQNLRPGGILLKTDSDARSSLKALRDGLTQGMQIQASKLPEFGGNATGLKDTQVADARARMKEMKVLLNEVLAFEEGFGFTQRQNRTGVDEDADQSTGTARDQILKMRKQN